MADKTSASLCWIFLSVCFLVSVSEDVKTITAEPGGNVTLPCEAPSNNITVVEWSREDETVCIDRKDGIVGQCETDSVPPSLQNRLQLNNTWIKTRNMSLILENLTSSDGGKYECRVEQSGAKRGKRSDLDTVPICIINLTVEPGHDVVEGNKNGNPGLTVGLPVVGAVLLGLGVGGVLMYRRRKGLEAELSKTSY